MTESFEPLWRTPTRAQAVEILTTCRGWTDSMTATLSDAQMVAPTSLGDGTWSVKDLLGHLAAWETRGLELLEARPKAKGRLFANADEFNAYNLSLRRGWSLERTRRDYDSVRTQLVQAIEEMDDKRWLAKVETSSGRSARALVLAKLLTGGRYGYFAHDFAHHRDLERSVKSLRSQGGQF